MITLYKTIHISIKREKTEVKNKFKVTQLITEDLHLPCVDLVPRFQIEALCQAFHMKMSKLI